MDRIFAITTASERVSIGGDGRGDITFTVTNSSESPLRGQLCVRPLGSTKGEWLSLAGESERAFSPNATQPVVVRVATPPGAPAGNYQFRLDAVSVINPDDDFTEGPTVDLEVKATEAPKKAFPWWIVAAAAGAVILGVALTWLLWLKSTDGTKVVFEDNFDEAPKGAWSYMKTETTPNGKAKFLGQFATDSVKLALKDLPPHKTVTVYFDLYINNLWGGGDDDVGPDEWGLKLDDGEILINTTFSNISGCSDSKCGMIRQAYACKNGEDTSNGCYSRGEVAAFGAAAINSLGYNAFPILNSRDSVYKIKHTFAHDKSDLILTFFSRLIDHRAEQRATDKQGWGLDNVRIEVHSKELSELMPKGADGTKVVFDDDFDGTQKGAWSQTKTDTTPNGKTKFLGQFWNDSVKLTLNDLPPHKIVTVNFDLYINNTWEGADRRDGNGEDGWGLIQGEEIRPNQRLSQEDFYAGIGPILIHTTFSNTEDRMQYFACGKGAYVSPLCYIPIGFNSMRSEKATFGAAAVNSLGFNRDSVYKIKRTFAHDKSNLILTFFGELKEQLEQNRNTSNESWGLDNVRIEVR